MGTTLEQAIIHSDPDILSGIPVFVGTRVPAKTLIDYKVLRLTLYLPAFSDPPN